jgi:hypothetical protein
VLHIGAIALGAMLLAWPPAVMAQSGCRSGAFPVCGAPEPAPVAAPTSAGLVAAQWRLLSPVFAALPAGGYPIAFDPNGAAQTSNLAGVTGWSMPASGRLELTGGGPVLHRFLWSERYGAFRHVTDDTAPASMTMVIAPLGLDLLRAAAAMERQPGDIAPALPPSLLRARRRCLCTCPAPR